VFKARRSFVCAFWAAALLLASVRDAATDEAPVILVLGDSISAAYGLSSAEGWVTLLQNRLRAQGYGHRVVNASVSGETTTGGLTRLPRALALHRPAIVVLELGGNDGLRGLPLEATRTNLQAVIERTRARHPKARIVLAGMRMPDNFGEAYTRQFEGLYRELAQTHRVALIPFLLDGVGGRPELNLPDQIHPNAEGHRRVATNVWQVLRPVLAETP